jgi:hypothetical protein
MEGVAGGVNTCGIRSGAAACDIGSVDAGVCRVTNDTRRAQRLGRRVHADAVLTHLPVLAAFEASTTATAV